MATTHAVGPMTAPIAAPASGHLARAAGAFLLAATGPLLLAVLFDPAGWSWLLLVPIGLAAGSVGGRPAAAWAAVLGYAASIAVAATLGLPRDTGPWWFVGAAGAAILVLAAAALGADLAWRALPGTAARAGWRSVARPLRLAAMGLTAVAVVGYVGFQGYVATVASDSFLHDQGTSIPCGNPGQAYGWAYEAVNYDLADDAALMKSQADPRDCSAQGASAGTAVVAPDGTRLAAWYIPAGDAAVDATGPTLVVVPGVKTNKSGMLEYLPALHDRYNLLVVDLRHSGRSTGDTTTIGLRERADVVAMLDWLVAAKHPSWIGAFGNSMGAVTALAAAVADPRIEALVLDSVQGDLVTTLGNIIERQGPYPATPAGWMAVRLASLQVGDDLTAADPIRQIVKLGDRPVLFTHGTTDVVNPPGESVERLFHAGLDAGVPAEIWYCVGAGHGEVAKTCPDAWAARVDEFLQAVRGA